MLYEKTFHLARFNADGTCKQTQLSDRDLWGLWCAVQHGIDSGYFVENREWAEAMAELIQKVRGIGGA